MPSAGILGARADWLTYQARAEPPTNKATKKAEKNPTEVQGVVKAVAAKNPEPSPCSGAAWSG